MLAPASAVCLLLPPAAAFGRVYRGRWNGAVRALLGGWPSGWCCCTGILSNATKHSTQAERLLLLQGI